MKFKEGIHQNIPYSSYEKIDALRFHTLVDMMRSPAHCRYFMDHPIATTDAMRVGEAVHKAILEPDDFGKLYVGRPEKDTAYEWSIYNKNTKKYKEGRKLWEAQHAEKVVLSDSELHQCFALQTAAWDHPIGRKLLDGPGMNETVICWIDPGTGLQCKARIDRLVSYNGFTIILDIKTTRNAASWEFGYDSGKLKYAHQLAFYRRGLKILEDRPRKCYLMALEKSPPYCAAVYEIEKEPLDISESTLQNFIYKFAECQEKNQWPGYSNSVEKLQLPKFSFYEQGNDNE